MQLYHIKFDIFGIWHSGDRASWYILIIKPTKCTNISNLFFGIGLYIFRTVPLSIISSLALYTEQWYMLYWNYNIFYNFNCSVFVYTLVILPIYEISVWHIPLLFVQCWDTPVNGHEKLSETCRVLFQIWIWYIRTSGWFYYKNISYKYMSQQSLRVNSPDDDKKVSKM